MVMKTPEGVAKRLEIARHFLFMLSLKNLSVHLTREAKLEVDLYMYMANKVIGQVKTREYVA